MRYFSNVGRRLFGGSDVRNLHMATSVPQSSSLSETALEDEAVRRVTRRLLPFLFILYLIASIDRSNVAFAALQMNHDLHFNASVFGFGAGIFFVGYCLLEIPSNLILARVGARRWISRIMISWGIIACAMMLIRGRVSFYTLRFLLGAAEAGFFPGMIFYLNHWFPAAERARAVSRFMIAIPVAGVVGGVLAGSLLGLNGRLGLAGWQWLFLLEGLPAVVLGIAVWFTLPDGPHNAPWLAMHHRAALIARLDRERAAVETDHRGRNLRQALANPLLWQLAVLWFLNAVCAYTFGFWAPQILKATGGLRNTQVGFVSALLTFISIPFMLGWASHSDRHRERRLHVAIGGLVTCLGFLGTAFLHDPILAIVAQAIVWIGINSQNGPFWSLPGSLLSGTAAAGGIALISSVAFMGGFVGPNVFGPISDASRGYAAGLSLLAVMALTASGLAFRLRYESDRRDESTRTHEH
jgi:MFS transporter, ACS family, tartrate transporter